MATNTLFSGLIFDENDRLVESERVGNEMFYIVDDNGFKRHVPSEEVDRQILHLFTDQIEGNEDYLSEQAATMMGQDDLFTKAILKNQMQNIDQHLDTLFASGIPEEVRSYLGIMGMKIVINYHGEITALNLPSKTEEE